MDTDHESQRADTDELLNSTFSTYVEKSNKDYSEQRAQSDMFAQFYKKHQDKLLLMTQRNSAVFLKKQYLRSNFDLTELEALKSGITKKVVEKTIKNIPLTLNERTDNGYSQNILLDSIHNDEADKIRGKLTKLSRSLKQIENEIGQQVGYIGFPFLKGHINKEAYVRGPVVLFPVSLEYRRQAKNGGWFLNFLDKRPIINGAMIAALKKIGKFQIPDNYDESFEILLEDIAANKLDNYSEDFFQMINEWTKKLIPINENENQSNITPLEPITKVNTQQMDEQKLHLVNYVVIGKFPQGDSEIYRDYNFLIQNSNKKNIHIFDGLFGIKNFEPYDEETYHKIDLNCTEDKKLNLILPSDPSQDNAILESKKSNMIVVRGPPGTGKSQLIVNMIADALTNNQKVLVVCQKRAALEVVQQRLGKVGLNRFVTFLEKESDDRRQVYRQWKNIVHDAIESLQEPRKNVDEISRKIDECVEELDKFGKALRNKHHGITAHKLYSLADVKYVPRLNISSIKLPETYEEFMEQMTIVKEIENDFKKFETSEHQWFGRKSFAKMGIRETNELKQCLLDLYELAPQTTLKQDFQSQKELLQLCDNYMKSCDHIKQTLKTENIQQDNLQPHFEWIQNGMKFWDIFEELSELLVDKKKEELIAIIQNNDLFKKSLRDIKNIILNIMDIIPSCILAQDANEQAKLYTYFDSYLNSAGLFNMKRSGLITKIKTIIDAEVTKEFIVDNYKNVKMGIEFWEIIDNLSKFIKYEKNLELRRMSRKPELLKSTLSSMNEILERSICSIESTRLESSRNSQLELLTLFQTHFEFIKNIENEFPANNAEEIIVEHYSRIKLGISFWEKFNKLLEFFKQDKQSELKLMCNDSKLITSYFSTMLESLKEFDSIQEYDKTKEKYSNNILQILEQANKYFKIEENWTQCIKNEIYIFWLDKIESENPILQGKPILNYNNTKIKLEKLIDEKMHAVNIAIQDKIMETIRDNAHLFQNEGFVKIITRKNRMWPLKKILERFRDSVFKVSPCWLASPESVSKTFPMEKGLFDLVIVDEASQLATERTMPFLYRAKRAVIAGDEHQLPPFDLFRSDDDDDEIDLMNDDIGREKSLLDEVRDHRYKTFNLSWHYRSRYQDLIDFSNHAFYDGHLHVAPNVWINPKDPPIQWKQCDGRWTNNQNVVEANLVVDTIHDIWKSNMKQKLPSIGVITFNEKQQETIRNIIERRLDGDAEFLELYTREETEAVKDTALFVKNIENVQGDERDIIIFSIGYAKNHDGKFANRFGMINKKRGENILNVAITRAKINMIVVASIDPSIISPTSKNIGPQRLRQFLEYAKKTSARDKKGQKNILNDLRPDMQYLDTITKFDSDFEIQVFDKLQERGYTVNTQVGESSYRIDLAIVHPKSSDRYILGIECDGATFHAAKSVKERDVMRQKFLETKGWVIERIWSRSWWKDPKQEIDRIENRINEILQKEEYRI